MVRCKGSSGGQKRCKMLLWGGPATAVENGARKVSANVLWGAGSIFNECFIICQHLGPGTVNFEWMPQLIWLFSLLRCAPSTCDTSLSSAGARVLTHSRFESKFRVVDFTRSHLLL